MNDSLSTEELARYSRHLILPDFNLSGQRKLKAAKVLVVGSGGLGSPLLLYLAAAGVGTLGIVDYDHVEVSNLQRQVLFTEADQGQPKAVAAQQRVQALNPHVKVNVHPVHLSADNALDIIKGYDVVADGTDNFPTRYLINDACVLLHKVCVYGSIYRYEGQVSVFNYPDAKGTRGPNYRDLFPTPPPPHQVPSCAEGGVLGVLPGIIGSMQANEVIKVIAGIGEPLSGRLFVMDAATLLTRTIGYKADPANPLTGTHPTQTGLIDYEQFCNARPAKAPVPNISVDTLHQWRTEGKPHTLIDVREPYEVEIATLGGIHIPQKEVESSLAKIPTHGTVVVHCRTGKRSEQVVRLLMEQHGYTNVINLTGGILAYAQEIDQTLARY